MKRVLVIDDHQHTHRLLEAPLSREGVQVLSAADGVQGLALAAAEKPDLIVLDVTMPGKGGFDVLRELKASDETRAIPVIMLTAQDEPEEIDTAMREGAAQYV